MKVIKRNVYYCDFCSKKGLRSIQEHENHCTANPKRWCRLCENSVELTKFIEKYKKRFTLHKNDADWSKLAHGEQPDEFKVEWTGEPITLEELEKEFDNCPCCVLSILRQTGMNKHYFHFEYDYKGLSKKYLDEKRRDQSYY